MFQIQNKRRLLSKIGNNCSRIKYLELITKINFIVKAVLKHTQQQQPNKYYCEISFLIARYIDCQSQRCKNKTTVPAILLW